MNNFGLYFDHLISWSSDVNQAASRLSACGFKKHSRSVVRNDGSCSEFILLSQAYIEFASSPLGNEPIGADHWTRTGNARASHALGFAISFPEITHEALSESGFAPLEIETEGLVDDAPAWRFVFVPQSRQLGPPLYFVKYLRDLSDVYSAGTGPNGITRLTRIEIAVTDPRAACSVWERFLSQFMRTERHDNCLVLPSPTLRNLSFVTARDGVDESDGFGITKVDFHVDDYAAASKCIRAAGIELSPDGDGAWVTHPPVLSNLTTRLVAQ